MPEHLLLTDNRHCAFSTGTYLRCAYLPFGDAGRAWPLRTAFVGLCRENASYAFGNGYRHFHPALMRFSSPDHKSPFADGGPNGYAYCAGEPINRADPSGHSWISMLRLANDAVSNPMSIATNATFGVLGTARLAAGTLKAPVDKLAAGLSAAGGFGSLGGRLMMESVEPVVVEAGRVLVWAGQVATISGAVIANRKVIGITAKAGARRFVEVAGRFRSRTGTYQVPV